MVTSYGVPVVVISIEDSFSKDELDEEAAPLFRLTCRGARVCSLERIQLMADMEKCFTKRSKRTASREWRGRPLTIEECDTHSEKQLLLAEEIGLAVTAVFPDPGIGAVEDLALEKLCCEILLRAHHVLVRTLCENECRLREDRESMGERVACKKPSRPREALGRVEEVSCGQLHFPIL